MTIEIAHMRNGALALLTDDDLPARVKYIEYYREQRLFQLVFDESTVPDMLVTREMDDNASRIIQSAPDMMVVVMAPQGGSPYGYDAPLIQIGV
jgi:hypothetical protein